MSKISDYNFRSNILQIAFQEASINLYDDILSYVWSFTYSKSIWRGLIDDCEGREFNIKINAFEPILELLKKTIELEETISRENMGDIVIIEVGKKAAEDNFGLNLVSEENIFLIYILKSKKCILYEGSSEKKYEINGIEQENFHENFIKKNCFAYTLRFEDFSGFKKMLYNMDSEVIDLKHSKLFKGIAGLKKLCEDIKVFSRHGDENWMSNISKIVLDRLRIVANIREANCTRVLLNNNYLTEFARNIEETCVMWKKLKEEKVWSLYDIALVLDEIIIYEEAVYEFSKSEAII